MKTFTAIMALWPTLVEFAEDAGVPERRARGWKAADSIPGRYWLSLVKAADRRKIRGVTLDVLAKIAATTKPKAIKPRKSEAA